ncbi:histidine phosphatase family protein [Tuberibacillus sp. Marseille-P3662]|uniref:histidine phosphatase family protein n=1 Tax=Tuberibacillus sp. Marseille-P3662 TaxID=1965358 RepID=UPI000A1CED3A|nr:histidine phosphatase family protein [Tuberibacillus sp. Marseille-P3662]
MEIVFIRHGQAEHTLNVPDSLQESDPALTETGVKQARVLKDTIDLSPDDVLIISPVRRTLETALLLGETIPCIKIAHPLVSPRMFPLIPNGQTLPCDRILPVQLIARDFPSIKLAEGLSEQLWMQGINTFPEGKFNRWAEELIAWCRTFGKERIYIVSHDGTITSYRQYLNGNRLTRQDFPKETGYYRITI